MIFCIHNAKSNRRGTDNRLMTTDEIQYQLGEMGKARASAESELAEIKTGLGRMQEGIVWFAAVPFQRSRDHVPVDLKVIKDMMSNSSYRKAFPEKSCPQRFRATRTELIHNLVGCREALMPSLHGITLHPRVRSATLELRRDGTVVFGKRFPDRIALAIDILELYAPWYAGLCLFADIQAAFGISSLAIAQAGMYGLQAFSLRTGNLMFEGDRLPIKDSSIELFPILLHEEWRPREVFMDWASQLANHFHEEKPLADGIFVPT